MKGLRLRDVRPSDRRQIFEFCRHTWAGYGDYLPRVWRRWLGDPGGRFIAAELDGVPVGLAKITDFGNGEIWLEGLRVDPRHRGKGIANAINHEVWRTLKTMRPRKVRYCTGRSNWASRHIGERFGFRIAARLKYRWIKSKKGTPKGEFARREELDAIYDFIMGSRFLKLTGGLVGEGWVFREMCRSLLEGYIRKKRVMVVRGRPGIRGVAIYAIEEVDQSFSLGFVDGDATAIKALIRNCPYLAKLRKQKECSISVPTVYYARLAREAGFTKVFSTGQVVLEHTGSHLGPSRSR